jgi:uncharacterized protein (TIGR02001 family)
MSRILLVCLSVSAIAVASPAFAQEAAPAEEPTPEFTVTGGVTLASQYRFRGISLSDEHAALQGTINLHHKSGFYGGVWASNIDGWGELGGSNLELDIYGGWRGEVTKGVTLDAGVLYYAYPGSKGGDFEFFEPYAKVSGKLGPVNSTLGVAYAWEQDALADNRNFYIFNDNSLPIPGTPISLTTHIGHSSGGSALAAGDDYLDWAFGASAIWKNLTFGVSYVDTNIDESQALSVGATKDIVDTAVVATLTASF